MTPIIDIDNHSVQMLPSYQRQTKWIVFVRSLLSYMQYLNYLFRYYIGNSVDSGYWSALVTYDKGNRVRSLQGVYESIVDGNIGNPITDTDYWIKVLDSFIGVKERVRYNGRVLTFEWALNRYFNTTFRQPDHVETPTRSDIYITDVSRVGRSFVMYPSWYLSSAMYPYTSAPKYMLNPPVYTAPSTYVFDINIPIAVYTALGSTAAIRESIVRQFADKYCVSGLTYNIVTY